MDKLYNISFTEEELHSLEVILSCVDYTKLVNTNKMALSMHHIKLSNIFLTLEKLKGFIQEKLSIDDE